MFKDILENVSKKKSLVYTVTNQVAVNDVVNTIAVTGVRPFVIKKDGQRFLGDVIGPLYTKMNKTNFGDIMVETNEVRVTVKTTDEYFEALNITEWSTLRTDFIGLKDFVITANKAQLPVILDVQVLNCLAPIFAFNDLEKTQTNDRFNSWIVQDIINSNKNKILIGELPEFYCLNEKVADFTIYTKVFTIDNWSDLKKSSENVTFIKKLATKYNSVILVFGINPVSNAFINILSDGESIYIIDQGKPMDNDHLDIRRKQLNAIVSAYAAANNGNLLMAACAAVCAFGIAEERVAKQLANEGLGYALYENKDLLIKTLKSIDIKDLDKDAKIFKV